MVYFTEKDSTSLNAKEKRKALFTKIQIKQKILIGLISFSIWSEW